MSTTKKQPVTWARMPYAHPDGMACQCAELAGGPIVLGRDILDYAAGDRQEMANER